MLILTAGADVQRDRVEIDVWGWGRALECWLVDHVVLEGDTARPGSGTSSRSSSVRPGRTPGRAHARWRGSRSTPATGRHRRVYAWARRSGHGQVIAIKGVDGFDRSTPVDGPTYVDVTEAGRKIRRGVRLWKVAGAVFKSETYRFLRLAARPRRRRGSAVRLDSCISRKATTPNG